MQYITTAEAAEQNAAVRMRAMGFEDARVTNAGSDGGIDVRSKHALAQVKWQGAQVGRPAVQQLYGARGSRHDVQLFFFAATGYSQHAIQYADECEIRLFTFDPLGVTSPANRAARQFLQAKQREEQERRAAEERARQAERLQREADERRARQRRQESEQSSREQWIAEKNAEIRAEFAAQEASGGLFARTKAAFKEASASQEARQTEWLKSSKDAFVHDVKHGAGTLNQSQVGQGLSRVLLGLSVLVCGVVTGIFGLAVIGGVFGGNYSVGTLIGIPICAGIAFLFGRLTKKSWRALKSRKTSGTERSS